MASSPNQSQSPHDAEVIVVGSGFGGAVAACRLAQAGFDVLVLERGRRYGPGDFPELPPQKGLLPDFHRWTWQHDQGLWDIRDLDEVVSVQAAGFGGGSLIYANVHLRAPELVFRQGWPEVYRPSSAGPHVLESYYDLAAYMLDVAPISEHAFYSALVKADQLKKAADALGRTAGFFLPPLTISRKDGDNVHGVKQKACVACGACVTGCPYTAKNTLDYNYLAIAERRGARIRTLCEVQELRQTPGGAWELTAYDHTVDAKCTLTAKVVFLAAGSIHTTELLLRAKLLEASKPVQKRVGVGYFPGGDALGVVYGTKHAQQPNFGPTIATTLVHNPAEDPGAFFMLQDGGYAAELNRLIGSLKAPLWVGRNRLSRRDDGEHRIEASAAAEHALRKLRELDAQNGVKPTPDGVISGVDDILNAIAADELRGVLPKQLVQAWPEVVPEISRATLMRAIVERTIETGLRLGWERFEFVRGNLDKSPWRQLLAFSRWLVRIGVKVAFGGVDVLATRATYAMLTAGGLNRDQVGSQVLGYDATDSDNRAMLLAMGRDAAIGVLQLYKGRLVADLDLFALAPGYANQERVMTDLAREFGGELRLNPAWSFYGKPITVHNQGGCAMNDRADAGVTDPNGQVRGCAGLYVSDGSLFCTSVGVNPSATILAIAERNVLKFIRSVRGEPWPEGQSEPGALEYAKQRRAADSRKAEHGARFQWTPPAQPSPAPESSAIGIQFDEQMKGYYHAENYEAGVLPPKAECQNDRYYSERETRGRPDYAIALRLCLETANLAAFVEDAFHEMTVSGEIDIRLPDPYGTLKEAKILPESKVQIFVPLGKPYAVSPKDKPRVDALNDMRLQFPRYQPAYAPDVDEPLLERFLRYCLKFEGPHKEPWWLWGYKRIRNEPGPDAWRATSSLYCCLWGPKRIVQNLPFDVYGAGVVHVDAERFLFDQLHSVRATGTKDPARQAWATATFASFFFGSLLRIYQPGAFETVGALAFPPHVKPGR